MTLEPTVFLNMTRGGGENAQALAFRQGERLALLPACREVFGIPLIAIGEYERSILLTELPRASSISIEVT